MFFFSEDAVLFGYLDGRLAGYGSIEQFYYNVDSVPGGRIFKDRIDIVLMFSHGGSCGGCPGRVLEEGWGQQD